MKKRLFIFVFLTLLVAILAIDYKPQIIEKKPDAYEVIKYMNNELSEYPNAINDYYLLFDSYKLDSKNFIQTLSYLNDYNYKIIEVYPYINPMYQSILNGVYKIAYNRDSLDSGIASIYNIYMRELEKYRLSDEIDKVLVNGVRIRLLKINLSNEALSKFVEEYKDVKYSMNPYGLFKKFDLQY